MPPPHAPATPAPERLSIVVPCFDEAGGLDAFLDRLLAVLDTLEPPMATEVLVVDDGSTDGSLAIARRRAEADARIVVLELSRNFGKEAALSAGLDHARGDAVVTMDADLQHPPELLPALLSAWRAGHDMVMAHRTSRRDDAWWSRWASRGFYRLHNALGERPLPPDVGDFRLLDRAVVDALRALPERRRFMKGLFAWVGFRTATVDFDVPARHAGRSRYGPLRLARLALEGLTSFSTVPLTVWTWIGSTMALVALVYGSWIIVRTLIWGIDVPGFASLLTAVLFLGGVQLLSIGVLGDYIGRVYLETKQRPLYLVRRRHGRGLAAGSPPTSPTVPDA